MAKITYKDHQGNSKTINVNNGLSVMEGAIQNEILGIDADCGGECSCATCHVMVKADWLDKTGAISDAEDSMLDLNPEREKNSRLACQIEVTEIHDGLTVDLPEFQF